MSEACICKAGGWVHEDWPSTETEEDSRSLGASLVAGSMEVSLVLCQAVSLGLQETTWALELWGPDWYWGGLGAWHHRSWCCWCRPDAGLLAVRSSARCLSPCWADWVWSGGHRGNVNLSLLPSLMCLLSVLHPSDVIPNSWNP